MKRVHIDLGERSYEIAIGPGLLESGAEFLPWVEAEQVFIVSNEVVAPLYLERLERAFSGKSVHCCILPDGEATKSLETVGEIFTRMLEIPLNRQVTVVALGGGVIGDMAGFAAACYQRGAAYIQVPTTLLAQVDSSVGGKTAVNHPLGKNMIGAFHQPRRVVADLSTLSTLDDRQFSAGLAEVIKYGVIHDHAFFDWLEDNMQQVMARDHAALEHVVGQSCINKAKIVEMDETERGARALLNFGHTFGHAIETTTGYGAWLHGEAVALGMVMAAHLSSRGGDLADGDLERIIALLRRANLPVDPDPALDGKAMRSAMQVDKKVARGRVRLVLLNRLGDARLCDDYDPALLDDTLGRFAG